MIAASDADAFTFVDGTSMRCIVPGGPVEEVVAPLSHPVVTRGRIAITEKIGSGYRIFWNDAQLKALPPEMHDFIFFHECAHASVPTQSEVTANCRGGFAVESKLANFYGQNNEYWRKTLSCANAFKESPKPPE